MLLFLYSNTTCFLHFLAPSSGEPSYWVKFGSFFHDSSLQLNAMLKQCIRNWLFDEFIDLFKRKLFERLSPFRFTSLFLYGCETIILTGTVPGGAFFPVKSLASLIRERKRGDRYFETKSSLFLPNPLFHPPLRMTLNAVAQCQLSPRLVALNDRLLLGLYNRSTETEEH